MLRAPAGARPGAGARRRLLAAAVIALSIAVLAGPSVLAGAQAATGVGRSGGIGPPESQATNAPTPVPAPVPAPSVPPGPVPVFAVGTQTVRLLDASRTIKLGRGRRGPRPILTYIRYPAVGTPGAPEEPGAQPLTGEGPFPLIVFGHGFGVTPSIYARLLDAWASAGYVVAAPLFPLGNAGTPGGPEQSDVVNQPRDVDFVISSMLGMDASGTEPLGGLINPTEIAVAGHSDGAETALAVAFSRRMRDPRVRAALVFSGAEMSGIGGFSFPSAGLPLLAVQGTADIDNEPKYTYAYFAQAGRPKFLLRLLGARHLQPYTEEQPQLGIVERASLAFLARYLKGDATGLTRLLSAGAVPGRAALTSAP